VNEQHADAARGDDSFNHPAVFAYLSPRPSAVQDIDGREDSAAAQRDADCRSH